MNSIKEFSKSGHAQAVRLSGSLEMLFGHETTEEFIKTLPLSRSADPKTRMQWARAVCSWLEERFSDKEIQKIRRGCSCRPGNKAEKVKRLFENSANYREFCEQFNREYAPENILSHEQGALYLSYPTCYCACVKHIAASLSGTWCLCTLGYAEELFSHALSHAVRAELMESVKTGGEKCVIKIIPV